MALILKQDELFEAFDVNFPSAYLVIDAPRLDKRRKVVDVPYRIYANETSRDNDEKPLSMDQEICQNNEKDEIFSYNDFFSDYNLNTYSQCYSFLLSLEKFSEWESDK